MNNHSRLLDVLQELLGHRQSILSTGCSPEIPGPRATIHVYWEILLELLGQGRSFSCIGMFSRNSWAMDDHSRLLGGSLRTPGSQTVILVYWDVLQELLGHGRPFTPTRRSTNERRLEAHSPIRQIQPPSNL
ncbi:hypothetical protein V8G54_029396 [Vigna mungo]|uniref:Uncharacterized protein n=1 Tax=Vigna mungo TaxID=3915 RepID=A0AAQ3MUJ3_VIGMU